VGTHGGSEDHTAILRCAPGALAQYRFLPVAPEAQVALPAGWTFAIGVSGVHAAKGGAVQEHYNGLARQLTLLLATWRRISERHRTRCWRLAAGPRSEIAQASA
jgi:galactokinase